MNLQLDYDWAQIHCDDSLTLVNNTWNFNGALRAESQQYIFKNDDPHRVGWYSNIPMEFFNTSIVRSYPQAFIGNRDVGQVSNKPFNPVMVKNLNKLLVSWHLNINASIGAQFNVAAEIFLHGAPVPNFAKTRMFELMVWTRRPSDPNFSFGTKVQTVEVGGRRFEVFIKEPTEGYIAFIATENSDLSDAIDWVSFITISDELFPDMNLQDMWLTAVELGTEMYAGEVVVEVKSFDVTVEEGTPVTTIPDTPTPLPSDMKSLYQEAAHQEILISQRHRALHDIYLQMAEKL